MAKAWLASQALKQEYVEMPWALNPRSYRQELGTSRLDWARFSAVRCMSRPLELTQEMYLESGVLDYYEFAKLIGSDEKYRNRSTLHSSGMSGGYAGIVGAREFLANRLIGLPNGVSASPRILLQRIRNHKVTVGVHVRAGDFGNETPAPGTFNNRIELSWYQAVIAELATAFADDVHFFFVTEPDAYPVVNDLIQANAIRNATLCSGSATQDLGILASVDLVVCSVSSFSLLAAFIGDNEFLWYSNHLTVSADEAFIWPDDLSQRFASSRRRDKRFSLGVGGSRGTPFPSTESVFRDLVGRLNRNLSSRHSESNLLLFGTIDREYMAGSPL
jgi:hypothetical protein